MNNPALDYDPMMLSGELGLIEIQSMKRKKLPYWFKFF